MSCCPYCEHAVPAGKVRRIRGGEARVVNLKENLPPVKDALRRLRSALQEGMLRGERVMKLIHGYGSGGEGGRIRDAARQFLADQANRGRIAGFLPGEDLTPGSAGLRQLRERLSEKGRRDPDLKRGNPGITFVLFR
jgi:hypothetical protein